MKKIAFIGRDLKFISHIIEAFKMTHDVRIDQWEGPEHHDEVKSREIVEWADILFCEWGLGNVVWYQEHKKEHQKLFVRLHRYEMNTKYPALFDYKKIDKLIAISPYIFEEFHRVAKVPREKMTVIYNAVETARFKKPKNNDSQFNIGIIGIVPKLKRIDRALDIFEELHNKDSRYKLFIKGKHPKEFGWVWNNKEEREHYEEAFKRIDKYKDSIFFEGWGDVSTWLQNIGFVLSVSDYESFHMAPIEGMTSNAYPVVLKREGVNTIFPQKYIHDSLEKAAEFIYAHQESPPENLSRFVENNYSLGKVCKGIENLFQDIEKGEEA
ncbi:glycosyltransferase family 4 protein (plasmid) [Rossellomorea sp. AcN35-11]|nr:glycosyltransferase family 4 protein [Rossellomorea aquimaris]WJV32361.1 glycosyltransferase family 4 protein [Rossellomorea sp. AcN35-11]